MHLECWGILNGQDPLPGALVGEGDKGGLKPRWNSRYFTLSRRQYRLTECHNWTLNQIARKALKVYMRDYSRTDHC